ncbi:hypothetical protein [Undibacterium curvum]|uniref:Uncharacterized protein n=1 Tax=Undibacterium curvum TaxID=2762294 RepID=A0ABR7A0D4_9BURK|nr:hypothetical protein [Undibacterium curvum]MBC3930362.1 hypothetical protein [Undibacterium curvum]
MKQLKEPSTWAGLAAVLQGLKVAVPTMALVFDGLSVACGGLAMVLRESQAHE